MILVRKMLLLADTEHLPQSRFQHGVRGTLAASEESVFKILNFEDLGDFWIPDLDGDRRQSLADVADQSCPRTVARACATAS
jgi:hypothetical protein